jgi:hypothetical protein
MEMDVSNATADSGRSPRRARRFCFLACGAVVIAALGGYAYGTIPNSATGVISGCYVKSGTAAGTLRVIDTQSGAACKATETAISWNSKGINDRGAWVSTTAYAKGDAVLYAGQTYLAKIASKGVMPTNTTSWQLLAARGATGPVRPAGSIGSGRASHDVVAGIGPNDVPAGPSFVAPANEQCLVTTTVAFQGSTIAAGLHMAQVRVAMGVNGGPFAADDADGGVDGALDGIYLVSSGVSSYPPPVTASWVFPVGAGQTIQFAAYFDPFETNAENGFLRVGLSYMCS